MLPLGLLALGLCASLPGQLAAQGALPVRFALLTEKLDEAAAFKVHFTTSQILADETWYVGGSCKDVPDPAVVKIAEFAHLADLEIFITDYIYTADRRVCIVNPDDAPAAFWRAYER